MKKHSHLLINVLIVVTGLSIVATTISAKETLQPFVLASVATADYQQTVADTRQKLSDAGFTLVGEYSPFGQNTVLIVTNEDALKIAAMSKRGAYGAPQRVAISQYGDEVEVSYANPLYFEKAYWLKGSLAGVDQQLKSALGFVKTYGSKKGLSEKKLKKYHYMITMPYFDDPYEYDEFDSYEQAVAEVEKRLDIEGDALSKVYKLEIPGTKMTIFGVQMKATGKDEDELDLDEEHQLGIVDFERPGNKAYLSYELLVNNNEVEALHMKYRMALHFPDLPMTGKHGFTKLMSSPGEIDDAFEDLIEENR
jgi:hypothetical protein